jgi:hypothetical protein
MGPLSRTNEFVRKYVDELPGVAATLTTTMIIFLASLTITPVRHWLFTPTEDYPVLCFFKPRVNSQRTLLTVEAFFVNRTDNTRTAADLQKFLDAETTDSDSTASPIVSISYDSDLGSIQSAKPDNEFNAGRGKLSVQLKRSKEVSFTIDRIDPYSILKADIVVKGREELLEVIRDNEASALSVPFDVSRYQEEGCFQRN